MNNSKLCYKIVMQNGRINCVVCRFHVGDRITPCEPPTTFCTQIKAVLSAAHPIVNGTVSSLGGR